MIHNLEKELAAYEFAKKSLEAESKDSTTYGICIYLAYFFDKTITISQESLKPLCPEFFSHQPKNMWIGFLWWEGRDRESRYKVLDECIEAVKLKLQAHVPGL